MNNRPQFHAGAAAPVRRAPANSRQRPGTSGRAVGRPVQGAIQGRSVQGRPVRGAAQGQGALTSRQGVSYARTGAPRPAMRAAGAHRAPARRPAWLDAPGKRFGLARLAVIAALVIYTVLVLGGSTARNIPFPEIDAAMSRAPGIETLFRMDANAFQERFGATPDGLEGWMLFGGNSVMEVSELLVTKSTDSDALNRLEGSKESRSIQGVMDLLESVSL